MEPEKEVEKETQREPVKEREGGQDMEEDKHKEVVQNREGKLDDYILVKFMPLKSEAPCTMLER